MKHIIIILCVIAGICSSCNDMLENIQPYLNEGETIYVGKVDSLTASSGRNRILLKGLYIYGVTQKEMCDTLAVSGEKKINHWNWTLYEKTPSTRLK